MSNIADRSSEYDISIAVMKYLRGITSKSATTSDVKKNVPNFISLTVEDKQTSETRENEQVWQQVVGNIVSHRKDSNSNFINRGLLDYDGKLLSITPEGELFLSKKSI